MPNFVKLRTYFCACTCTFHGDEFVLLTNMNKSVTVLVAYFMTYFYGPIFVLSVTTAHNLTPEKRDNNYSPHPLTPTSCLRNNIQLITGISPCYGYL